MYIYLQFYPLPTAGIWSRNRKEADDVDDNDNDEEEEEEEEDEEDQVMLLSFLLVGGGWGPVKNACSERGPAFFRRRYSFSVLDRYSHLHSEQDQEEEKSITCLIFT